MHPLIVEVKNFLKKNHMPNKPILLGYSGGYDSKALFFSLLKLKKECGLDLHLAHIDHGWRKESFLEAEHLKKEANSFNVAFHYTKIALFKNNLEAKCRELRFKFFKDLYEKFHFQAILLAHHKDDLLETVLKRFLEGSELFNFTGMKKISLYNDMVIWRPFLNIFKKDIKFFLQEEGVYAIDDKTNYDRSYLRARMRCDIIPNLQKNFRKNFEENICIASQRSFELTEYLDKKTKNCHIVENSLGLYVDLDGFERIEKRYVLNKVTKRLNISLSRECLERILNAIENLSSFSLQMKSVDLNVYRSFVFFFKTKLQKNEVKKSLQEGINKFGNWKIEVKKTKGKKLSTNWRDAFTRDCCVYVPINKYDIVFPKDCDIKLKKKLFKRFSFAKVPSFMRFFFPVICREDTIVYEFLSGKMLNIDENKLYYMVKLSLSSC